MLLKAENISKSFYLGDNEIKVLDNINFSVDEGEKVAVLGPSGTGKSTLLNVLSGLTKCDSGKLFFEEKEMSAMNASGLTALRLNSFGFIFQAYHLISTLTVSDNILVPVLAKKQKPDMERIEDICEKLNLSHRMNHLPHQLSGGEMQRVAIARAIIGTPRIIFSDEATGNLDEENSRNVMELLNRCCEEYGIALVYVTHDESLTRYADSVRRFTSDKKIV